MGRLKKDVPIVNIDRKGLSNCIKDKGFTKAKLSIAMGYANNYLTEMLRDNNPKKVPLPSYQKLCTILQIPESKFLINETPAEPPKTVKSEPTFSGNIEISPNQFNALLQAISTLGDTLEKIAATQSATAIIQGKVYSELLELSDALGVTKSKPQTDAKSTVTIKPQYSSSFGGKK